MPKKAAVQVQEIVTLQVTLVGYWPQIWRTCQVPMAISLSSLHEVIQEVMGWSNTHLHEFEVHGRRYGDPEEAFGDEEVLDSGTLALSSVVMEPGDEFTYEYDLGDGWEHRIIAVEFGTGVLTAARCLAGARQCPPEDCGGVPGFRDFLQILQDPEDEERAQTLEWCGGEYDPMAFNVAQVNKALKHCKLSTRLRRAKALRNAL